MAVLLCRRQVEIKMTGVAGNTEVCCGTNVQTAYPGCQNRHCRFIVDLKVETKYQTVSTLLTFGV